MKIIKDQVSNLNIEVSDVLQFFIWQGLTVDLQSQLVIMCNEERPSLENIEQNIFKAVNRCKDFEN